MKDNQDTNSEVWEVAAVQDSLEVNFVGIGSCMENIMRGSNSKQMSLADSVDLVSITWRCLWVSVS